MALIEVLLDLQNVHSASSDFFLSHLRQKKNQSLDMKEDLQVSFQWSTYTH